MKHSFAKRAIALLLALVCIMGILPLSAFAATGLSSAPSSITQKSSDYMKIGGQSVRYRAASSVINNVGLPYVFDEQVTVPGMDAPVRALCAYQKGTLGPAANGQKWNFKNEVNSASLKVLLTYIYAHTYGNFTEAGNAIGLEHWNNYWSDIWFMVAQAASWLYEHGAILDVNSNREGFIEQISEEFIAAMRLYHQTYGQSSWITNWDSIGTHSIIDSKEICSAMRHAGFRWAPSVGAWQRQLNDNAIRAADQLQFIRPLFGERPSDLQKSAWRVQSQAGTAYEDADWANWDQMSVEERLAVDFCKLVRQRFPDSTADGPAESKQVTELAQIFLTDGKRAADEMMLTVAGFVMGTELPQEIQDRADNLMTRLARYKNSVTEKSEHTQTELVQKPPQEDGAKWGFYIIADLKTWADNAENRSPLEHFPTFEAAKARFDELRGEGYNSEVTAPAPDGQPPARLTLGLESADGMSAADILHVRQGQNYLVTDFTRMARLRDDPAVSDILSRLSREIGFDLVRVHEQTGDRSWTTTIVPFAEWDDPYFPAATPGRFAARYYEFQHLCYPLQKDEALRPGWIKQIVQYIQSEGTRGIENLTMTVTGLAAGLPDYAAVQEMASGLIRELDQYGKSEQNTAPKQKTQHKKSQER